MFIPTAASPRGWIVCKVVGLWVPQVDSTRGRGGRPAGSSGRCVTSAARHGGRPSGQPPENPKLASNWAWHVAIHGPVSTIGKLYVLMLQPAKLPTSPSPSFRSKRAKRWLPGGGDAKARSESPPKPGPTMPTLGLGPHLSLDTMRYKQYLQWLVWWPIIHSQAHRQHCRLWPRYSHHRHRRRG